MKDAFNQKIDRRNFLQKTTKLAGAAVGLSLLGSLGSTAVHAESGDSDDFSDEKGDMLLQFGLIADAQYADVAPMGTRFYRNSVNKLTEAANTFNQQDLAFTIHLGDLVDRDASSFAKIIPVFNQINGTKYHLLGNHDYTMDPQRIANMLHMPNFYYDFSYQGFRFVVLDTNDLSTYANPAGSSKYQQSQNIYDVLKWSGADNAQTWNGGVGNEQMAWLHDVLAKSAKAGEKVVVIGHHPLAPLNMHNAWNDHALIKEFEASGNVVAYFNGHNHAGNYALQNGIHYLNFKGMVETADTNAYSIVQVYADRIQVKGFGREQNRTLKFGKKGSTANIEHAEYAGAR